MNTLYLNLTGKIASRYVIKNLRISIVIIITIYLKTHYVIMVLLHIRVPDAQLIK